MTGRLSFFLQLLINQRPTQCSSMEVAIMLSKNMHWVAYYGGFDVTVHVLSEVLRAGRINLLNVRHLQNVALEQGNAVICHLFDLYNSGTFQMLNDGCLALTARILQAAFSARPIFRVSRARLRAPDVLNWSQCPYTPLSSSVFAESFHVAPSSYRPRLLILTHCGVLNSLSSRLAISFKFSSNFSCESRFYSVILRRVLNVAFARKLLKYHCLQTLNVATPSRRSNQVIPTRACVML
jgi:hypothetical protein